MTRRQKNNFDLKRCASLQSDKNTIPVEQYSVLPLFPSAPKPIYSNRRLASSNGHHTSGMLNNSEDIIMTPCNTIILQTTIDGKIQVSRTQKERERNPDRLSLDRRGLTVFPILVGEAKLRLLSLQHNLLTKLERMALMCLHHLVFLDIYNNQLENISALDCLHHLRVLLLGKNRIKNIEGLTNMTRLEVLDLHGNQITEIRNMKNQKELKVLNLAGNEIKYIGVRDLEGLCRLQEMNLRRNQIKKLSGFGETPQLFKLFLSNNDINSIEELNSIKKLSQLKELSLDGNPVIGSEDCIYFIISYVLSIQLFGQTKITDDIRRVAKVWRLRREFNEKSSASLDTGKFNKTLLNRSSFENELKRTRSASENRISYLRKRNAEVSKITKSEIKTISAKYCNRESCSAKQTTLGENAKSKHSNYVKRNTVSVESNNSNETNIEYFRLPPILTSSLNTLDDCNVALRNDPNTSLDSNKSYCSIRCESVSSMEKSASSSSSSDSDNENSTEENAVQICNDVVPVIKNNTCSAFSIEKEKNSQIKEYEGKTHRNNGEKIFKLQKSVLSRAENIKEQGGDYLVQISGRYLIVTGKNSAKYIDKVWNSEKANDVITIKFSCVMLDTLTQVFNRIKYRFPNAEHLVFSECEFNHIGQLNSLADIQGLSSLEILPERNAIVSKNWRSYAVYRLHHWGLRIINNVQITEEEVKLAKEEYEGLSDMVLWSLPESSLTPLLNKLRLEVNSNISAKQWLYKADPAFRSVICKEALQWRPTSSLSQNDIQIREKGRTTVIAAVENACNMVLKLRKLDRKWKSIMSKLVCDTLNDYSDINEYTKEKINNLKPP